MNTETVINNKYVTLYFHHDKQIVHHIYHPGIGGEYLKEALLRGVDLLQEHGAFKWLSNNSDIDPHTDEETEWINSVWLPKAIQAGWKYWALVVPESTAGRMNMNEFVTSFYNKGVRVMVFTNADKAMQWLIEIDKE